MKAALVCIAKNEDNYILEWIAYHQKLGFDSIFIYQNNWQFPINIKGVHTIEFNGECQQLPAYNHFIENYSSSFEWVAFIDVDEFFVLKKHSGIKDFLVDFKDVQGGLAINWVMFGSNGQTDVKNGNYAVLSRFTRCAKSPNRHIKSILRIKRIETSNWLQRLFSSGQTKVRMINPHFPNIALLDTRREKVEGPFNPGGPVDLLQINHYFIKSSAEFRVRNARVRADQAGYRNISSFDDGARVANDVEDFNDMEDFTALNFYLK
jgi:hypothetical protein